uniref:Uncharacterized protein n=1 Tax=Lepeophtheirus salmonis TaxID=72036 RepID=A0A0K2US59_LEPSM
MIYEVCLPDEVLWGFTFLSRDNRRELFSFNNITYPYDRFNSV